MEPLSSIYFELVKAVGLPAIILIIWFYDYKRSQKDKRIIESLINITKNYEGIVKDLKDLVVMNTEANTRLSDDIRHLMKTKYYSKGFTREKEERCQ